MILPYDWFSFFKIIDEYYNASIKKKLGKIFPAYLCVFDGELDTISQTHIHKLINLFTADSTFYTFGVFQKDREKNKKQSPARPDGAVLEADANSSSTPWNPKVSLKILLIHFHNKYTIDTINLAQYIYTLNMLMK